MVPGIRTFEGGRPLYNALVNSAGDCQIIPQALGNRTRAADGGIITPTPLSTMGLMEA